ncbi:MAG: hypothetical protein EBQ76_02465 [Betaproteobacteria bacterium]|nr:hypothetical protein [Betaproteobacteria bacterium]
MAPQSRPSNAVLPTCRPEPRLGRSAELPSGRLCQYPRKPRHPPHDLPGLKDHAELPRQAFLKVLSLAHRRRMTGPSVLLMTEKDAVKFGHSPTEALCPWWALRLDATLDPEWTDALLQKLKKAYG